MFNEKNLPKFIIFTPIIALLLASVFIIYFFINNQNGYFITQSIQLEQEYIKKQKDILRQQINYVINYINYHEKNNKSKNKKEFKNNLLKYIQSIRFPNNGYIWVHNTTYKLLAHPFRKNKIGKNDINLQDKIGTFITKKFVNETIKNPNGVFIEYYWQKPNQKIPSKKLGFFRLYKNYNWVIGTGLYMNNIQKNIHEKKIQLKNSMDRYINIIVSIFIIVMFAIGLISLFISNKINKLFKNYQKNLKNKNILLKNSNNNLELKIQKAIKNEKEKDRAMLHQSRLARMGVMLSMISHQWRQPLSKVSALIMEMETSIKFKQYNETLFLNNLNESTNQLSYMSNTIDDFINFFKPDKQKIQFNINDACNEALSLLEATIKNYGIKINKNFECNVKINGYEREFAQVILNLLSNAKDILKQNKIKNPYINIDIKKTKQNVIITIKDNAGGIKEENINIIFEPYYTTKEKTKGSGLGLYMSKMIIEKNMDGELSVQNINNGALFTITLKKN